MPYNDPVKQAAYFAAHYRANKQKKLDYAVNYRAEHPEDKAAKRERGKRNYEARKEHWRQRHREYDITHVSEKRERNRVWHRRPDVLAREKARREARREILNAQSRALYRRNREKRIAHIVRLNRKRAELRRVNGGHFTKQEWIGLCATHDHRCLCCRKQEPQIKLTADHVVPLCKGGSNDIANIQPLCHSCNAKKATRSTDYRVNQSSVLTIPRRASAYQPGPAELLKRMRPFTAESASLKHSPASAWNELSSER